MNESLIITQIIEKNGRAYAFLIPFGCPYTEIYEVLAEFEKDNRGKQEAAIEAEAKKQQEQDASAA